MNWTNEHDETYIADTLLTVRISRCENEDENKGKWIVRVHTKRFFVDGYIRLDVVQEIAEANYVTLLSDEIRKINLHSR